MPHPFAASDLWKIAFVDYTTVVHCALPMWDAGAVKKEAPLLGEGRRVR